MKRAGTIECQETDAEHKDRSGIIVPIDAELPALMRAVDLARLRKAFEAAMKTA